MVLRYSNDRFFGGSKPPRKGLVLAYCVTLEDMLKGNLENSSNIALRDAANLGFYEKGKGIREFWFDFIARSFLIEEKPKAGLSAEQISAGEKLAPPEKSAFMQKALADFFAMNEIEKLHLTPKQVADFNSQTLEEKNAIKRQALLELLGPEFETKILNMTESASQGVVGLVNKIVPFGITQTQKEGILDRGIEDPANLTINLFINPVDQQVYLGCAVQLQGIFFESDHSESVIPGPTILLYRQEGPKFRFIALETNNLDIYRIASNQMISADEIRAKYPPERMSETLKPENNSLLLLIKLKAILIKNADDRENRLEKVNNKLKQICLDYIDYYLSVLRTYFPPEKFAPLVPQDSVTEKGRSIAANFLTDMPINEIADKLADEKDSAPFQEKISDALKKYAVLLKLYLLLHSSEKNKMLSALKQFYELYNEKRELLEKVRGSGVTINLIKSAGLSLGWKTQGGQFVGQVDEQFKLLGFQPSQKISKPSLQPKNE